MTHKKTSLSTKASPFDLNAFLTSVAVGKAIKEYRRKQAIFVQGSPADAVFYIKKGKVKLTVLSAREKEAVIAILGSGDFCGEGCLAGQPLRMATANRDDRVLYPSSWKRGSETDAP